MKQLICLILLSLAACAPKSSEVTSSIVDKELFSSWDSGSGILDLSYATYGIQTVEFKLTGAISCFCFMTITGNSYQGDATIGSCAYTGFGAPQCPMANHFYTYTHIATTLNICSSPTTCTTYH